MAKAGPDGEIREPVPSLSVAEDPEGAAARRLSEGLSNDNLPPLQEEDFFSPEEGADKWIKEGDDIGASPNLMGELRRLVGNKKRKLAAPKTTTEV